LFSTSATAVTPQPSSAPRLRLGCAGITDTGLYRLENEDRHGLFPDLGLFLVADGMGGAAAGEVAARMAVEHTCRALVEAGPLAPAQAVPGLVSAIQRANEHIHAAAEATAIWRGMGTTLAALLVFGHRAVLAHVGDSRIYRLRGEGLSLLTEDHSLFNAAVRAGLADPDHPERFPRRNVITRAIGTHASVEVEARVVALVPGDTFLLCTDGLSGVVSTGEMAGILLAHADLETAVEQLVARANQRGGPDNITAIAVRCEASGPVSRAQP
jgi:protein phosphatase